MWRKREGKGFTFLMDSSGPELWVREGRGREEEEQARSE
jgi:hypothetical protein